MVFSFDLDEGTTPPEEPPRAENFLPSYSLSEGHARPRERVAVIRP